MLLDCARMTRGLLLVARRSVQSPFHMAALQSLLQLLGVLVKESAEQDKEHGQEMTSLQNCDQQLQSPRRQQQQQKPEAVPEHLYLPSDPNIRLISASKCAAGAGSSSSHLESQEHSMEQHRDSSSSRNSSSSRGTSSNGHVQPLVEQDHTAKVTPRDLGLRLQQLSRASTTSAAAAASCVDKQRLDAKSMQQINGLIIKTIKAHDKQLLQPSQRQQQQQQQQVAGRKQEHKKRKQQQEQQQAEAIAGQQLLPLSEAPAEGLALVQYLKWSMEALTDKHMAELAR